MKRGNSTKRSDLKKTLYKEIEFKLVKAYNTNTIYNKSSIKFDEHYS